MRTLSLLVLVLTLALLGCGPGDMDRVRAVNDQSGENKAREPLVTDSVREWGYFFAADRSAVQGLARGRKGQVTVYRVNRVVPVRGKPGVKLKAGSTLVRLEIAARFPLLGPTTRPALLLQGVPQHLEYTTRQQRDDLKRSRAEVPASADTLAVVIPIRKSAAWWALPQDQRQAYFQKTKAGKGHTAIGAEYVDRVYRKLYHARYAVETADHDFITYFEFKKEHEGDFKRLLGKLRDRKGNPEWGYVDREYEIWLTKLP
jgi:hypothetical protein